MLLKAEVNYLGRLSHPNLVKLIGYCLEDEHHLLVRFLLRTFILESSVKNCSGCAKGLAFLHSAETQVIYRDSKTSNILLDSNYNAKLSDFGLAKDGPTGDDSHVSTRVIGTYGYADPDYLLSVTLHLGHLTTKSDVYSYGVVLLEMLSGRKVVDNNRPPREKNWWIGQNRYLQTRRRFHELSITVSESNARWKKHEHEAKHERDCYSPRTIQALHEGGGKNIDKTEKRMRREKRQFCPNKLMWAGQQLLIHVRLLRLFCMRRKR
ncbi:hypothetical protein Rs2_46772 [Raphanus sativus]|nr:hypothetical protein Rs2_46772 [Raphanus sativus]